MTGLRYSIGSLFEEMYEHLFEWWKVKKSSVSLSPFNRINDKLQKAYDKENTSK